MFGFFRKKTQVEKLISTDGIDNAADQFAQIIAKQFRTRENAYQFILQELDGASIGNDASQSFAKMSGIKHSEYKGALDKSIPEVDGPGGPQQVIAVICMQLISNKELMAQFRCKIDERIMSIYELGKYGGSGFNPLDAQVDVDSIEPGSRSLDRPEFKPKRDYFYKRLSEISERPSTKKFRIDVMPCDGSYWSWAFEFSEHELAEAESIFEEIEDYFAGWVNVMHFEI